MSGAAWLKADGIPQPRGLSQILRIGHSQKIVTVFDIAGDGGIAGYSCASVEAMVPMALKHARCGSVRIEAPELFLGPLAVGDIADEAGEQPLPLLWPHTDRQLHRKGRIPPLRAAKTTRLIPMMRFSPVRRYRSRYVVAPATGRGMSMLTFCRRRRPAWGSRRAVWQRR